MKPLVLYYRILRYQPENLALLKQVFELVEAEDPREDDPTTLEEVRGLFAPLGFRVDEPRMERCPKLEVVISNTTSIPHIDAEAAARRGVTVCALHDEQAFLDGITPTAEHTVGLMMALWRRIPAAHDAACRGEWDRRPFGAPRMLSRMRLGLVGYGRLGRRVGRVAEAMGMDVAYYDPALEGSVESLEALAERSDVLSLHAPGTPDNAGLVSRAVLERLPRGAIVINTARGELLDTDGLLDLMENGALAGAALDTIDGEYFPEFRETFGDSRLVRYARDHDNLLLTPHIGGSTVDAWTETERRVIDKACAVLGVEVRP